MSGAAFALSEAQRQALYRVAWDAFPNECCGWLTATAVRPCRNAHATSAHVAAATPTAMTAYAFDGDDLLAFAAAFASGDPPRAVYHSHPNGRAYFSDTDKAFARSPWGDAPAYPVAQVVIGVAVDGVREVAIFAWARDILDFVETGRWNVV